MCNFPESTDTTLLLITTFSQRKRGINGYRHLVAHRLILQNHSSIKGKIHNSDYHHFVEDFFSLFPAFVPPTASLPPIEQFITHSDLQRKLDQGLIAECWRSYLYWLCNDGDHRHSNQVVEMVQRYLPDTVLKLPQLTHSYPPQVLIEFEEGETNFDISVSGGGLRTISSLAFILHFTNSKCLLLDEPDSHLHSTLQHQVAQMLLDYSIERNVQVFVTSHAPDFIAEIPVKNLTWVDRTKQESRTCSKVGHFLADLGAVTKADAIRNGDADKILFIEGGIDRKVLTKLASIFCQENTGFINPFTDKTIIIAQLPNGKGDIKHLDIFQKLLYETFSSKVKIACIVDNDYDLPLDSDSEADTLLLRLQRKEIENYFIEPNVIHQAVLISVEKQRQFAERENPSVDVIKAKISELLNSSEIYSTVKCQVTPKYRDTLGNSLDSSTKEKKGEEWFEEMWSDQNWKIRNCPGKDVLAKLRDWCKNDYKLNLSAHGLTEALTEIPEDIEHTMQKL